MDSDSVIDPGEDDLPPLPKPRRRKKKSEGTGTGKSRTPRKLTPDDLRVESPVYKGSDLAPLQEASRKPLPLKPMPKFMPSPGLEPARGETLPPSGPKSGTYFARRNKVFDILLAVVLGVMAFASVVLSYRGIGHSWDEALYLKPATSATDWLVGVIEGHWELLAPDKVAAHWGSKFDGDDSLHPEVAPIPKYAIGLGSLFLSGNPISPVNGIRVPVAAFFGLTVVLLYLLGTRAYGRIGGFATVVCYIGMPRVFGHAHIAASETILAFGAVFLVWAWLAGIANRYLLPMAGLAFAFAVSTKVTALVWPLVFVIWGLVYFRRQLLWQLLFILLIAPLVVFAIWPLLWHDGIGRLAEYLDFYRTHQSTAVFYLGNKWGYIHGPPAPWHYPFVITGLSLPEWLLPLLVIGVVTAIFQSVANPVPFLFLLMALLPMGISALPFAPKYDGERLFFSSFGFLSLLAGGGFAVLARMFPPYGSSRAVAVGKNCSAALLLIVASVWSGVELVRSHPNELGYFNRLVGGPAGAYESGFETTYWGEGLNEQVLEYLNGHVKPGQTVKTLALNELAFKNLQDWGLLKKEIDFSPAKPPFDWFILQVRQGFLGSVERALHFSAKPAKIFSANGVPRIEIFHGDALGPAATGEETSAIQVLKQDATTTPSSAESTMTSSTRSAPETSGTTTSVSSDSHTTLGTQIETVTTTTATTTTDPVNSK
ncbi:MAG: hypothetical protein K1X53_09340 [Candidatus Sumerlaeaceae bacterium]|nr:hypothetical protein [Candidatus Sumerlaeaceae bacterium]